MKVCVLVSGGLDSTVAYHLATRQYGKENVTALFVEYGQPYSKKEATAISELKLGLAGSNFEWVRADLCVAALDNVPTVDKQEIYGRNLLLCFYGALIGERVWMSALENEINASVPDKEYEFFWQASSLLSLVMKNKRPRTFIETPFEKLTKTEVVYEGLKLGLNKDYLLKTVSCYDSAEGHCGNCLACYKRWIAFSNNGINVGYPPPINTDYANKVIDGIKNKDSHYSSKRVKETESAYNRIGIDIWR